MLGSGVPQYEQQMRRVEQERPDHFRGWVGFSIPVSHRIMAGCDILLMPSRFEPCGLNQLFAMRYGTIPIAHATGGLRDTIEDYNPFAQGVMHHCTSAKRFAVASLLRPMVGGMQVHCDCNLHHFLINRGLQPYVSRKQNVSKMMLDMTLSSEQCHLCLQHELCFLTTALAPASCFMAVGNSSYGHPMLETKRLASKQSPFVDCS